MNFVFFFCSYNIAEIFSELFPLSPLPTAIVSPLVTNYPVSRKRALLPLLYQVEKYFSFLGHPIKVYFASLTKSLVPPSEATHLYSARCRHFC